MGPFTTAPPLQALAQYRFTTNLQGRVGAKLCRGVLVQAVREQWRRRTRPHMVTLVARSPNLVGSSSWGSLHHQLSVSPSTSSQPAAGQPRGMSQAPASQQPQQPQHQHQQPARKATRNEILEAFIGNLRQRGSIDLDAPGVLHGIREHFQRLPSRYALDVNISTLDVLNHKRYCTRLQRHAIHRFCGTQTWPVWSAGSV